MATRKVQLTAAEFARRRVLGALLRPTAGGVGEGVPRPFRTMFAAAVVVMIALGTAGVVGYLHPRQDDSWQRDLIADGSGTEYVMLNGRLYPVLNPTSADLILGPTPKTVKPKASQLAPYLQHVGPAVGLANVPATVPPAANLDLKDWTACVTPTGKTVLEIGYPPAAEDAGALSGPDALLVKDETGDQWLIEDGQKYRVGDHAAVAAAFGTGSLTPRRVPTTWLNDLSAGDVLGVPSISGHYGGPDPRPAPPGFNRIGMFGRTPGTNDTPTSYYLVTGDGIAAVTPTMYDLYRRDPRLTEYQFTETTIPPGAVTPDMMVTTAATQTLSWPPTPPHFTPPAQEADPQNAYLCATISGELDAQGRAHTEVATRPSLPAPIPPSGADIVVRPGHGALVRESGSDPATSPTWLLTDNGTRHELPGTAPLRLGYDGIAPSEVPPHWLALIPQGQPLDPTKAALPPN